MNTRTIDRSKKSNIKCEHCKYWRDVSISKVDRCTNSDSPKYDIKTNYYNRCKSFEWKEGD